MKPAQKFASLRSYYFHMYVCNYRQRQVEACESQDCNWSQLRSWFRQAGAIVRSNPYLLA